MQHESATKNVTFRSDEEDFQVQLIFELKNGKLVASPSSRSFLNFLKSSNLVDYSTDDDTWFNSCDDFTITFISPSTYSLKIRMKADILGLKVIPGKNFQEKRERDCKSAFQKWQRQAATN